MKILYILNYDSVQYNITKKVSEFKDNLVFSEILSLNFIVIICGILFNYYNILDLKKIQSYFASSILSILYLKIEILEPC